MSLGMRDERRRGMLLAFSEAWAPASEGVKKKASRLWEPEGQGASARRRPGYPLVGLRARRARLRLARQEEDSTGKGASQGVGVRT